MSAAVVCLATIGLLAGSQAFAAKRFSSQVTLAFQQCSVFPCGVQPGAHGEVISSKAACERHRKVTVRATDGSWTSSSDETDAEGVYYIDQLPPKEGRYKAVAAPKELRSGAICTKAVSPPVDFVLLP